MARAKRSGTATRSTSPPLVEWIVAAVGVALVVGALSFLTYEAVTGGDGPPDIVLRADSVHVVTHGFLVMLVAENRGDRTAAQLLLEGALLDGDREVETSELTIDFLPGQSRRNAGLFFANDPRSFRLRLLPKGFDEP